MRLLIFVVKAALVYRFRWRGVSDCTSQQAKNSKWFAALFLLSPRSSPRDKKLVAPLANTAFAEDIATRLVRRETRKAAGSLVIVLR